MIRALKHAISRWLCPEVHRDAQRYLRLWNGADEARWWLGKEVPEAAALAQWLIDKDHWYWTSEEPKRDPHWTWQPPEWVTGIDSLRFWLTSKAFRERATPETTR